jgi:flagellar basal body-associated protein FliL
MIPLESPRDRAVIGQRTGDPGRITTNMSDKPKEKKAEAAPAADGHGDAKKKGGIGALLTKLPVLLGGVMVIEAAVLFGAFKMFGGSPAPVAGAELHADAHGEHGDDDEGEEPAAAGAAEGGGHEGGAAAAPAYVPKRKYNLSVIEFRAPNKVSGRMFLYDVQIDAQVLGANAAKVKAKLESRKALISDRVRTIIAQSDPEKLNGQAEPGLETLKRQVKVQLEEIVGEGLIDEVLVPRCIPFRADF